MLTVAIATSATAFADPAPDIDRAALRDALAARRKLNLQRFHDYRKARVYPHNTYEPGMLNVWRDAEYHLCAVATIVSDDGHDGLVGMVATDQNNVRIADITSGPLYDWALTSGFTQEELAMIQYPNWAEDDPVGYARAMRQQREQERARKREDQRLAAGYLATERVLKQTRVRDAGLDVAVARLAARPELAAALLKQAGR